ncbi:MAG: aminopeptidase P family protein [Betaproteobacteria bacterium]|nr:MAG: aminopeptidase P family protein [Betaproteobacteria bacterium]
MTHTGIDELKSYYPGQRYSSGEMERRYEAIRKKLAALDYDCLLVYGQGYNDHANVRYLSDYEQMGFSYVIVPRSGPLTLFYGFTWCHDPTARIMSVIPDVRYIRDRAGEVLADELRKRGLAASRIAVPACTGPAYTIALPPADHFDALRKALPKATFVSEPFFLDEIRMIKSREEIARTERAAAIGDQAMRAVIGAMAEGVTDADLYRAAQRKTMDMGGQWKFAIVGSTPMSKPNLITPYQLPLKRRISRGDIFITEIGTAYGACESLITRPISLGPPTKQYLELFDIARESFNIMYEAMRPGKTERDLWEARTPILKRGLKFQILAHGMSPMEPYLTAEEDLIRPYTLQEGMVISLEPKPYIGEHYTGDGIGMFLSDTVVIEKNGPRDLNKLPMEFFQV